MSATAAFEFNTNRDIADLAAQLRDAWVRSELSRGLTVSNQYKPNRSFRISARMSESGLRRVQRSVREAVPPGPQRPSPCEHRTRLLRGRQDRFAILGEREWVCRLNWWFGAEDNRDLLAAAALMLDAAEGPLHYFRDVDALEVWYDRVTPGTDTLIHVADLSAYPPNIDINSGRYLISR